VLTTPAGHAERTLPAPVWDYIQGGAGTGSALAANRAAFDSVRITPRVLRGIADPDPATDLFGPVAIPAAIAPMAYPMMVHPDGELAVARAAAAARIPMAAPLLGSVPIETLAQTGATLWYQLYWLRDRGRTTELVRRAQAAGCQALILTIGAPAVPPDRLADADLVDPTLSWADLAWLRAQSTLPLLVKGVLHAEDAKWAVAEGADAIIVSNHGGRHFDAVTPALHALPAIRDAVGCPLILDSGVRSGLDVLRALALGAHGVLLGRPILWGLASGADGVTQVLDTVRTELTDAMRQAGVADIAEARTITRIA
jgi:4-hydroxymandelate oxidase